MPHSIESQTEKFKLLPDDAQAAIKSFDYDTVLQEIYKSYKLHIDQAYILEKTVAQIVFGEIEASTLLEFIQKELRLDHETAVKITLDVNIKILKRIQEKMREIQSSEN